jgi:hypothetical protein
VRGWSAAGQLASSGHRLALWVEYVGTTTYNLKARRFTPAAGWGLTALLGTSTFNHPPTVAVAMDANGRAMAVWERQQSASHSDVYYAQFTTSWGNAALLESGSGSAEGPAIASAPNGVMVAAWIQARARSVS